jgi:hypothetical protein
MNTHSTPSDRASLHHGLASPREKELLKEA